MERCVGGRCVDVANAGAEQVHLGKGCSLRAVLSVEEMLHHVLCPNHPHVGTKKWFKTGSSWPCAPFGVVATSATMLIALSGSPGHDVWSSGGFLTPFSENYQRFGFPIVLRNPG